MTFHNVCTEGTFDSVIAKICINKIHFEWFFFRSSGPLEPRHHPTYYSRKPMNYWFSIETHNHVYTNETFYSMYGWYGSNVHYMWKIVHLEPRWDPISFSRHPMNDNFIFGALNHVCTKVKFDLMYGWYGSNGHYVWKMANFYVIFDDFLDLWRPDGTPYSSPDALWMIILSFGHSILYVPMRNLIQCMGDMALMAIICEK